MGRRLNPTKEAAQLVLSEAYKDSANDNSANHTIDDLCALVNHSAHEGVAKLCEDLSGVGLDESVYCGHDVVTEEKAGQVLEPSFTMREVLGSDDLEQTYTAVADRCEGTTGRQMAWYPGKNYGWCSMAAGFLVGQKSDTADYCDASPRAPRWKGLRHFKLLRGARQVPELHKTHGPCARPLRSTTPRTPCVSRRRGCFVTLGSVVRYGACTVRPAGQLRDRFVYLLDELARMQLLEGLPLEEQEAHDLGL